MNQLFRLQKKIMINQNCTTKEANETVSLFTPPDLGKKFKDCKEENQKYEVVLSNLNTKVNLNFYQVIHEGINRKWPDNYIQTQETEFERLALTSEGKNAYTKFVNMLDLSIKTVTEEEKNQKLSKEIELIKQKQNESHSSQQNSTNDQALKRRYYNPVTEKKKTQSLIHLMIKLKKKNFELQ